ncbi:MAG: hypothetical protein AAGJ95_18260, partial [Cyanobacteria bacterium J06554_11]
LESVMCVAYTMLVPASVRRMATTESMATETRNFELKTTDGKTFLQQREVPVGSNWPAKTEGAPPKPSVVAIRRTEAGTSIV